MTPDWWRLPQTILARTSADPPSSTPTRSPASPPESLCERLGGCMSRADLDYRCMYCGRPIDKEKKSATTDR